MEYSAGVRMAVTGWSAVGGSSTLPSRAVMPAIVDGIELVVGATVAGAPGPG